MDSSIKIGHLNSIKEDTICYMSHINGSLKIENTKNYVHTISIGYIHLGSHPFFSEGYTFWIHKHLYVDISVLGECNVLYT